MQKRSLYSLLLTSFMLVFAFSLSQAQTVTFESKTVLRCQDNTIDVTVDSPTDLSAIEIVFNVSGDGTFSSVAFDPGLAELTHRYIDLSNLGGGVVRIAGMMIDPGDNCLAAGQTVVAQVNLQTADVCNGAVVVDGTSLSIEKCGTCVINATTQFVDCTSCVPVPAAVTAGTVTIQNAAPTISPIANQSEHWTDAVAALATAVGADADLNSTPGGCETLTYSISAPSMATPVTINSTSGVISLAADGDNVGCHTVTVTVTDACNASASTDFELSIWNIPPTLACDQDTVEIYWGYNASGTVTGFDPDGGPSPLEYSVCGFSGPGAVSINPVNGDWSWDTDEQVPYLGCHTLCIEVTDKANVDACSPSNSAQCEVTICVLSTADIVIEKTHNTIQGGHVDVAISIDWSLLQMGGFDLLISYDASALAAVGVTPGQLLVDCGWEYFEYRFSANGNCGNQCPSGMLRIVAIAEMNNGMNHPACFGPSDTDPYELAVIDFTVTNDRTFECMYVPVRFFWGDCGDNAFSNVLGDLLYLDRRIYDFEGNLIWDEEDDVNYPEAARVFPGHFGAPDYCLAAEEGKPMPRRIIDFHNGGVDIVCADSIDARGDINLNNVAHEVADAVLFTNYFVYGLGVFTVNVDGQIAATDVNADGITLSVADLVHLIRVIVGDADPYFKFGTPAKVNYVHAENGVMTVDGAQIGAAFVVAEGEVIPQLKADGMEMRYNFDGNNTRILVYSLEANSFSGEFLNVDGNILSIELATADGNQVNAKLIPDNFSLAQNYPNPFNPATSIPFSLPQNSDYTLTIFNVSGQTIATFEGAEQAGEVVVEWDATNLASGIYFYRLDAGTFSQTKKMVLLK